MQFYVSDHLANQKLARCSWPAQGAWTRVMCHLHLSQEYGIIRWPLKEFARLIGCPIKYLAELIEKGVLKGADKGKMCEELVYIPRHSGKNGTPFVLIPEQSGPIFYCSRMVRDNHIRLLRSGQIEDTKGVPKGVPKGGIGAGSSISSSASSTSSFLEIDVLEKLLLEDTEFLRVNSAGKNDVSNFVAYLHRIGKTDPRDYSDFRKHFSNRLALERKRRPSELPPRSTSSSSSFAPNWPAAAGYNVKKDFLRRELKKGKDIVQIPIDEFFIEKYLIDEPLNGESWESFPGTTDIGKKRAFVLDHMKGMVRLSVA